MAVLAELRRRADSAAPLTVAALIGPPLAVYAPLGMAPLFALVALASLVLSWRDRPWRAIDRHVALTAAVLLAWCTLSSLWSPDIRQAVRTGALLAAETFGGLCLAVVASRFDQCQRRRLTWAAAAGLLLAVVVMLVETYTSGLLFKAVPGVSAETLAFWRSNHISRGVALVAIAAVPVAMALYRQERGMIAAVLAGGLLAVVVGSYTLAAKLALPVAVLVMVGATFRPRFVVRGWAVLLTLLVLAAPVAALLPPAQQVYDLAPWLKGSSHHRLTIWRFTALNALEKPLYGWGLDGARKIPGADDEIVYYRGPRQAGYESTESQLPLHPHNAALQWWLELGGIGAVLMLAFLTAVLRVISRCPPSDVAPAMAAFAAASVVAMVSFGIWQSWWLSGLWLIAATVAGLFVPKAEQP